MGIGSKFGIIAETGNNIVTDGLVFYVDSSIKKSYPRTGTNVFNLASGSLTPTGSLKNDTGWEGINPTSSFDFDGSDDYIAISPSATISGKAVVSISTWIKPTNLLSTNKRIYDESTSTSGYTRIGLEQDADNIQLKWRDSDNDPGGSAGTLTTTDVLSTGVWVYIVGVWDSNNNEQKIYINGTLNASSTTSISSFGTSTTHGINIGRGSNATNYFEGYISNVQIYTRALSSAEILQNYNAQKDRFGL